MRPYNHKGRGYDGAVISAPIEIKEERYICSVVITRMKDNRFYLHEVIEQKKLSDEGSNSVQRQPQRLKAFAKILQNILSAKDLHFDIQRICSTFATSILIINHFKFSFYEEANKLMPRRCAYRTSRKGGTAFLESY